MKKTHYTPQDLRREAVRAAVAAGIMVRTIQHWIAVTTRGAVLVVRGVRRMDGQAAEIRTAL